MPSEMVKCGYCGTSFVPARNTHKWCSQKCAWNDWNDRQPKKSKEIHTKICEQCGRDFEVIGGRRRRFCSPPCNVAAQNAARQTTQDEWRVCPVCQKRFQPNQVRGVGRSYCSDSCRGKMRYRRLKGGTSQKYYADYAALFIVQDGKCGICGKPETIKDGRNGKRKKLALDHCHSSGKLRGLLCSRCNAGLGYFKDDPARLRAAITYLSKFT